MQEMQTIGRLKFFPVTFFASVMGLSGLSIAIQRFFEVFNIEMMAFGKILTILVTGWFFFLTIVYLMKFFKYPEEVKKEFKHPVKLNFLPTFSISLILLSIAYLPFNLTISYIFWISGAFIHLILLFYVINRWVFSEFKIVVKNPSWFIPVVGPILVPISGVNFSHEISWFYFSIGITLWLPILTILLYRLIFAEPLQEKLMPTLFIFLAPPAVAFISYVKLTNNIDFFAKILINFSIFSFLLLLTFMRKFVGLRFFLSWWAYTFPMAAFTISLLLYYKMTNMAFFATFGTISLILTAVIVGIVTLKTLFAIKRREICVEE